MVSFSKPSVRLPFCFGVGLLREGGHTSQALSVVVFLGCPSRFAGGQRTALGLPSVFGSRSGALNGQALTFCANQVAGFGHEV